MKQAVPQTLRTSAGRRCLRRVRAVALGMGLIAAVSASGAAAREPDVDAAKRDSPVAIAVSSGWFYPGLGEDGTGFGVRNFADGPRFFDAFTRYGGLDVMGYPTSRPWIGPGGFIYQLTQRALMQWSPDDGKVQLANVYEILREAGHDEALFARSIPRTEPDESTTLADARAVRMGWMTDSAITQAFLANPIEADSVDAAIELHGLPMSRPETFGPFVVQRFQRTALQHWVEAVDGGQPVGTVVLVNSGDHYKDLVLGDSAVTTPHAHDDTRMLDLRDGAEVYVDAILAWTTQRNYNVIDDALAEALRLLEGVPSATPGLVAAAEVSAPIRYRSLPIDVYATFNPPSRIAVNRDLQHERLEAVAAVLAHELQHLADFHDERYVPSDAACLEAEIRAVIAEASAWSSLMGAAGAEDPQSPLERMENSRLQAVQAGSETVRALVEDEWSEQCSQHH
ncbi:MAG: hypothetical protein OXG33_07255 [Chloroflexi bacterium]|nr:hypothetical protein [Chloroflexota bacterium]